MTTEIDTNHKAVLIRLTASYPEGNEQSREYKTALYNATRMWWKIAASRTVPGPSAPDYAFSVHQGRVKAVYSIASWHRQPDGERFGFDGALDETMNALYRDADLTGYFPKGAVNPVKFVNCAPTAQTAVTAAELATPAPTDDDRRQHIRDLVDELETEPLMHIMFGGRELFHSNLLAWFGKRLSRAASDVFDALYREPGDLDHLNQGYIRNTERERAHLDVCVWWDDHRRPLVIENKVFSLPDIDQLYRYAERIVLDAELPEPRQILLSLQDPQWPEDTFDTADSITDGRAWHRVSYGTLARLITNALATETDCYEVLLMRQYALMIGRLQDVADAVAVHSSTEVVGILQGIDESSASKQLFTSLSKLRARGVAQIIQSELDRVGLDVTVDSGFSNGSAVITGFYSLPASPSSGTRLGWQLQGGDLRLFAILPNLSGNSQEDIKARNKWALENAGFFSFSALDTHLRTEGVDVRPKATSEGNSFNRFNPDFVYRSKKVNSLTVEQLIQAASAYARWIAEPNNT